MNATPNPDPPGGKARIYHAGDDGYLITALASGPALIPCRVESVSDTWVLLVTVTAEQAAGGYVYLPGQRIETYAANVRPAAEQAAGPDDFRVQWFWCDGFMHGEPCPQCGDVHRYLRGIPGAVYGGVWLPGASTMRCRGCDRMLDYRPDVPPLNRWQGYGGDR